MKGNITIGRPYGGGADYIEVDIVDHLSGVTFIRARIGYEDFAKLITGQGYVPCDFELRGKEFVGMKSETKKEKVFVPDGPWEGHRERAEDAVRAHEIDGWVGRVDDACNWHKKAESGDGGVWYNVTFQRYVEVK